MLRNIYYFRVFIFKGFKETWKWKGEKELGVGEELCKQSGEKLNEGLYMSLYT